MQASFIEELAKRGNVRDACLVAGIPRRTAYDWRAADSAFAAAWDAALDEAADTMEREAFRRAVEGVDEPVYGALGSGSGTGQVGVIRKYSDTLLIFLMKAARPSRFRERHDVALTGKIQHGGDPDNPAPIRTVVFHAPTLEPDE